MRQYALEKKQGIYYVIGLEDHVTREMIKYGFGDNVEQRPDTMLLVRYPEGDCDTVNEVGEEMHRALYDLYQTDDGLEDGDEFTVRGRVVYRCEHVHVVEVK